MMRIGIVGTGGMAKERLRCFGQMTDVRVAAVYSRNLDKAHQMADEAGIAVYDDYQKMLDVVDVVAICVPNDLHFQFALEALEARRNVLVEYPFTANLDGAKKLCAASLEYKSILMVGNTIIHEAPFKYIDKHKERLGELVSAASRVAFYSNDCGDVWFFNQRQLGSVFAGLHYHHIEYYKRLLGEPVWVMGQDESSAELANGNYRDFVGGTAMMGYAGNKTSCVQWYLSRSGGGLPRAMWLNGTNGSLTLITLQNGQTEAVWNDGGVENREVLDDNWGVDESCKDFIMAVNGRLDDKKRLMEDMQTFYIAMAIQESAQNGQLVYPDHFKNFDKGK